MLDEFKTYILGSLSEKIDTRKLQNNQKTEADALAIFVQNAEKKHALIEFPLDAKNSETCMIFSENHEIKGCPSILGLKVVFQEETVPNVAEPL